MVPDEFDLEARLCRALDISKSTLTFFGSEGYVDSEAPANNFRPEKAIAETAMLLYAASGVQGSSTISVRVDEIARMLVTYAHSNQTVLSISLHPALCLDFALPHILLSAMGYPNPAIDEFIRSSLPSQFGGGHERPPFGVIEQLWVDSLRTDAVYAVDWRSHLRSSVLNRPLDTLGGLREDAYAFTHLLMYCTDFGFRGGWLPRKRSLILNEATALLAKCLDDEDYDLAGEVVLAWPLMGAPWNAAATFALRVLTRVEDEVGVLPGGTTKATRLGQLRGEEKRRYALGTAYHTAYVMGLVCAASMRPGRSPYKRIVGPGFERSFVEYLLEVISSDQGHWHSELAGLDESERSALGPLLLDLAIVQKYRKHEYQGLRELLSKANLYGAASSNLCRQAAELLARLSLCAHAIDRRDASTPMVDEHGLRVDMPPRSLASSLVFTENPVCTQITDARPR